MNYSVLSKKSFMDARHWGPSFSGEFWTTIADSRHSGGGTSLAISLLTFALNQDVSTSFANKEPVMNATTIPGKVSQGIQIQTVVRWCIIAGTVYGAMYIFLGMQRSTWVFPVTHSPIDEKVMVEQVRRADEAYQKATRMAVTDPGRAAAVEQASYELTLAVKERLDLIDQSQTSLRQELAESFLGVSFALSGIFLVLVAGLVEKWTRGLLPRGSSRSIASRDNS
jgi:hypothetical protein